MLCDDLKGQDGGRGERGSQLTRTEGRDKISD